MWKISFVQFQLIFSDLFTTFTQIKFRIQDIITIFFCVVRQDRLFTVFMH